MKRKALLFCVTVTLVVVGTVSSIKKANANEAVPTCPTANCNGGNLKCCSSTAGTWYIH